MDRVNVPMHRGRTVTRGGYEMAFARVGPDGRYSIEGLPPAHKYYLLYEAPGAPSTRLGPVDVRAGQPTTADIAVTPAGAIAGRVANVPEAMAGMIWVVAFDDTTVRREAAVSPDGTFRIDDLPPGHYGLKAGHDAYEDPHSPKDDLPRNARLESQPWSGAVNVDVNSGETAGGILLDFRPPPPLEDPKPLSP